MANVYIENGEIILIDDKGVAYEKEIADQEKEIFSDKVKANIFLIICFGCILSAASQVFFSFFSGGQIIAMVIAAVITGFISGSYFEGIGKEMKQLKAYVGEFNQNKCRFQNRILELEKELVKHEKEIAEIRCSQELDFAQNFKKQESKIPKSMLVNG